MVPENNNSFPLRWPANLAYLFRGGRLLLSSETHTIEHAVGISGLFKEAGRGTTP